METPRRLAEKVFAAALKAVDSERLVRNALRVSRDQIRIADRTYQTNSFDRVVVVGAGKAGAGMAAGLENALAVCNLQITGRVNVPENCVQNLPHIDLIGARPAGQNEPTQAGVDSTQKILELVSTCGPRDLCIVLISGGGSALLPAPVDGLSIESKRAAIANLAAAGASIQELNTVRRRLSLVKGGGLLAACRAGAVETLLISDVIGDDLATIASGPTQPCEDDDQLAEKIYRKYVAAVDTWPPGLAEAFAKPRPIRDSSAGRPAHHTIIGSNHIAIAAAELEANHLGCDVVALGSDHVGEAADVGRAWAERLTKARATRVNASRPLCLIDGGEPVVTLAKTDLPRSGGRNQEVVLAALTAKLNDDWNQLAFLSGGTDGEDGPTDAAGAVVDHAVRKRVDDLGLDPNEYLSINNSYPFFEAVDGLVITGPTHTNVMDIRIGVIGPISE